MIKRLLRFGFEQLYHSFAWSYDLVATVVSAGMWQEWIKACLPYLAGARVLELGYGPGHLQIALLKNGIWSVGVDASRQMSHLARRNLAQAGLRASLNIGYAQYLCFMDGCFDQVVATFPSDYILDPNSLKEIWRVLKPGGLLVVVAAAWANGDTLPFRLTRWLARPEQFSQPEITARWLGPFEEAGFAAQSRVVSNVDGSQVWMILAEKTAPFNY